MVVGTRCGRNPVRYLKELIQDSYHRERGQAAITAHGGLAAWFGLVAEVKDEQFRNVFDGYTPDRSKKLVHSTHRRHPGVDIVFAPPKWFSALYALAPPPFRKVLEEIFAAAVHQAMQVFASDFALARRGAGGKVEEHAKDILYFLAIHPAGRQQQPHIHAHVLLPNIARRHDGSTGTLNLTQFFENRRTLDTVFTETLQSGLSACIGHELLIPPAIEQPFRALVDYWSPGTHGIDELLSRKGIPRTPKAAELAQMSLRGKKTVVPYDELFTRWREEARSRGITFEQLIPLRLLDASQTAEPSPKPLEPKERAALTQILLNLAAQLTATKNYFSEDTFLARTVRLARTIGAPSSEIASAARQFLRGSDRIVRLGESNHGQPFFTTAERWREEQRLLAVVREAKDATVTPFGAANAALSAQHAERRAGAQLGDAAREALYRLATSDRRLFALDTGRSDQADTLLRAVKDLARSQNLQVVAATSTAHEAAEFQRRTGIKAQTVNQWFLQYGRTQWKPPRDDFRKIIDAIYGKRLRPEILVKRILERSLQAVTESILGKPGRLFLSSQTLLVATGAHRLPVGDLATLMELGALTGGRTLLVGDTSGLPALAHGGGFAGLAEILPTARVHTRSTATTPWLRAAQKAFSREAYMHAFSRFAEAGRLRVAGDIDEALLVLIRDWRREGVKRPQHNVILTHSNELRERANALAQRERWKALRIAPLHFLRVNGARIHQSDRVVLQHAFTVKPLFITRRVKAGELATVVHVDVLRRRITLKTDGGIKVTFDPKRYPDFIDLGYAFTTSRAETLRASKVHALIGPGAHETLRATLFAAEHDARLYTTRPVAGEPIEALARAAERRQGTQLAVSLDRQHQRFEQARVEQQHNHRPNR